MRELNPLAWFRRLLFLPNGARTRALATAFLVAALSVAAVWMTALMLKPAQRADFETAQSSRIETIVAALPGLADILREADVDSLETRLVELQTGLFVTDVDPAKYDPRAAAEDPAISVALAGEMDVARIGRRAKLAPVHILRRDGKIALVVLPVYGRGYQSIISAQLSLRDDFKTVAALTILEQGETPGIGSRIEDPEWLELWRGRQVADETGAIRIAVVWRAETPYEVDGISGATRTTNGITNMLRFWLGDHGFGPFLSALRSGKIPP